MVHSERVDEGRWESEGGQPVHKMTTEASPEMAISDLAKTDNPYIAAPTATAAATNAAASNSDYDAGKMHPQTIEGKTGDAAQSHYPEHASTSSDSSSSTGTDSSGSSGSSDASAAKADSLSAEPNPPVARKKSISERLAETWQDLKHKVEDKIHKK